MDKFECYIKTIYPYSDIKHLKNKTIVITEEGLNFSYLYDGVYYNIDFVYVFDAVKGNGLFTKFVEILKNSECNIKIINVVSEQVNSMLQNFVKINSKLECIEIPSISFRKNDLVKFDYSDDELGAIDENMEEWLMQEDGIFEDYIVSSGY